MSAEVDEKFEVACKHCNEAVVNEPKLEEDNCTDPVSVYG